MRHTISGLEKFTLPLDGREETEFYISLLTSNGDPDFCIQDLEAIESQCCDNNPLKNRHHSLFQETRNCLSWRTVTDSANTLKNNKSIGIFS